MKRTGEMFYSQSWQSTAHQFSIQKLRTIVLTCPTARPRLNNKILLIVKYGQFTSGRYLGECLDSSPVKAISIRYTAAPLVFCTESHFNEIEVKFLLVTVGIRGFGGREPSPANMEEKFCTCAKNAQLLKQLLLLF